MRLDLAQLAALNAAVSEGTFEAAARALHVTPSAISQRVKALEIAAGRVLLVRSKPITVTDSGQAVLRLARQIEVLEADITRELVEGERSHPIVSLPLAVNADSLATWVLPALAPLAPLFSFHFYRADEELTSSLLREGVVMAAITTDAVAAPGCSTRRLGAMRYHPMASSSFAARWFPDGVSDDTLAEAPVVTFDHDDTLHLTYLRRTSAAVDQPTHHVPSATDVLAAVRLGYGWGMIPDLQSADPGGVEDLVSLDPGCAISVVLHWQQWQLRSPSLDRVRAHVLEAGKAL